MIIDVEAIILDSDGTLIDSTESIMQCWTKWRFEQGVTAQSFAGVDIFGRTAHAIVSDLLPPSRVADAVARYQELEASSPGGKPIPGAPTLIAALSGQRWAIVTSACRAVAEARLSCLDSNAPVLVTADDVVRGKPDPEGYLAAARRLEVDPARCVVVEDAPAGLAAARSAGMRTIAVTTTHSADRLVSDIIVRDISSITAETQPAGILLRIEELTPARL